MRTLLRTPRSLSHYYSTLSHPSAPMADLRTQKANLRKSIRSKLQEVTADDVADQSSEVTKKVAQLPAYRNAQALSVFLSMPGKEIATRALVLQALEDGKQVYVPYIYRRPKARFQEMDMIELISLEDLNSLKPDAWGIPTLGAGTIRHRKNAVGGFGIHEEEHERRISAPVLDLIFIPALAFDRTHARLGHGKGFYDRYLEKYKEIILSAPGNHTMPQLIGLALKQQVISTGQSVPVGDDDWVVDEIITADE